MSTELWTAGVSRGNVLSTELNSLANAGLTAVGAELANQTNLDVWAIAVLSVTFGSAPTLNSICALYAVCAVDGTNYESGSATIRYPQDSFVGSFQLYNSTSALIYASKPFMLRPFKTKFALLNNSGQAFPASGSTVALWTFNRSIVG